MEARFGTSGPGTADEDSAKQIWALLLERRQRYTLAEIALLAGVVMTAHDDCILDWPKEHSAIALRTAQYNDREFDRVLALLHEKRAQEQEQA